MTDYTGSVPSLELGILAFQLVPHQRVRVHDHLVLLDLQDHEAGHRLGGQGAEGAGHRTRVYELHAVQGAEL